MRKLAILDYKTSNKTICEVFVYVASVKKNEKKIKIKIKIKIKK